MTVRTIWHWTDCYVSLNMPSSPTKVHFFSVSKLLIPQNDQWSAGYSALYLMNSYCQPPLRAFCSFTLWSPAGPSPTICPEFPTCLLTSLRCPASRPLPGWGRCVTARVYGPAGHHHCLLLLTYAYYSKSFCEASLQALKPFKYI